jgi:lipopolysaccharide export system protein LptA
MHAIRRPPLIRIVVVVLGIALATWGIHLLGSMLTIDPYASMRKRTGPLGEDVAVRMSGVTLIQYDELKELGLADIERIDVRNNRMVFDLYGVSKGRLLTREGEFKFSAEHGKWDSAAKFLEVNQGARVWNDDIDLQIPAFHYDGSKQEMRTDDMVKGKVFGGQLLARGIRLTGAKQAIVGPGSWTGMLALAEQEQPRTSRSPWKFEWADPMNIDGDLVTYTNATATDGEVIVKGSKIQWNRRTNVLVVTGKVSYYSPEANLTADRADVFRRERRVVLLGNVDMMVKPRDAQSQATVVEIPPFRPEVPDAVQAGRPAAPPTTNDSGAEKPEDRLRSGTNLRDYPTVITANRIEYWYRKGERRATITGNPQARQQFVDASWRHVWAHQGFYDGEKETLRLIAKTPTALEVIYKNSIGDDMKTQWVQFSTKEGDEIVSMGKGTGVMVATEDDEDIPEPKREGPPPPLSGRIGR